MLDVRSPIEVARGALPGARSMPLMTDDERHAVGLRYKEAGQAAAIELGFALAGPALPARIAAWRRLCRELPTAVTCWRGGLRSTLVVGFIGEPGAVQVDGGYKAIRSYLLRELPTSLERRRLLVLTGMTGSGKTRLLRRMGGGALQVVDLEGAARHRGSSFGAEREPQPSQQTFENEIAAAIVLGRSPSLVVEDESRFIGRRTLPAPLLEAMGRAPVVLLETPKADRVRNVFDEYVRVPAEQHGVPAVLAGLESATRRLRKRIGGGRCDRLLKALASAQECWFDPAAHEGWIGELLDTHYDRLYRKVIDQRARPVIFRGDASAVLAYLRNASA